MFTSNIKIKFNIISICWFIRSQSSVHFFKFSCEFRYISWLIDGTIIMGLKKKC